MQDFYNVHFSTKHAKFVLSLNGFPVINFNSLGSEKGINPIDVWLCKDNILQVEFTEIGENPEFSASVFTAKEGEFVNTRSIPDTVIVNLTPSSIKKGVKEQVKFSNKKVDFSNRLLTAKKITDKESVIEYGKKILKLIKEKDLDNLYNEILPKLEDYSLIYGKDIFEQYKNIFPQTYFENQVEVNEKDLNAIPFCDGRIWEIRVKEFALIRAGFSTMNVFVGLVDGQLKIVR